MTNLSGATTAVFIVRLSAALEVPVTVDWQTKDGTAKAGTDYEAASGSVTFEPGETAKNISVVVYGRAEGDTETRAFSIQLYPPENAILDQQLTEVEIQVIDSEGSAVTSLVVATGPRGVKGDPGLSSYELAKLQGFTGTLEEYIERETAAGKAVEDSLEYAKSSREYAENSEKSAEDSKAFSISSSQAAAAALTNLGAFPSIFAALSSSTPTIPVGDIFWVTPNSTDKLTRLSAFTRTGTGTTASDCIYSFGFVPAEEYDAAHLPGYSKRSGWFWALVGMGRRAAIGLRSDNTLEINAPAVIRNTTLMKLTRGNLSVEFVKEINDRSGWMYAEIGPNNRVRKGIKNDGSVWVMGKKLLDSSDDIQSDIGPVKGIADAWGDSKTAGTGGTPYPTQLGALIGPAFTVNNYGIGGQKSTQIAMRMGARPIYLSLSGDAIPAKDGTVNVLTINGDSIATVGARNIDTRFLSTTAATTARSMDGYLCGVHVRITRTATGSGVNMAEVYTLTALEGSGIRCVPGSLFTPDYALDDGRDRELWIDAGINDFRSGVTDPSGYDEDVAEIKKNIALMLDFCRRTRRKVLLFGLTTDDYSVEYINGPRWQAIRSLNFYLSETYPQFYVRDDRGRDLRERMIQSGTMTGQDLIDYQNDIVPTSLRSDARHPNTAGYAVKAQIGFEFRGLQGFND